MKRKIRSVIGIFMVFSIIFGILPASMAQSTDIKKAESLKKVLIVIAPKDFEDAEVFEPKTILEANGANVSIASITTEPAIGVKGRTITPDIKISEVKIADYDAIVVAGGTGVISTLWDNLDLRGLLQEANNQKKIIGAICAAPPVLAKAGLLKDKNATMFPWDEGINELTKYGAKYVNDETVVDGNIVTAKNPDASKAFGLRLCDVLGIRKFQKKVLMVIAPKDFEDVELFEPKTILELNGAKVTVASTTTDMALGSRGAKVKPDIKISDAKAADYDAIVISGGTGVIGTLWDDKPLRTLLKEADKQNKIISAICAAPPALAKAGLLNGKNATMFPWDGGIKELTKYGAHYVNEETVVSENIITGRNPEASKAFGLRISEQLGIKEKQKSVLMVIAPKDFADVELFDPKTILEIGGAKVSVASITTNIAIGMGGRTIVPDLKISDAKAKDYDGVVVVGGNGVIKTLWNNITLRKLLQDANAQNKIVAAICAAPPALAKAGLLKNKTATMYPFDDGIKELTRYGANYVNEQVVVSGNIVTGRDPDASRAFGLKLCDVIGVREYQKNVLMVIAQKDFEDVEFFTPKTLLELNGAKVTVASITTDIAKGMNGSIVTPDIKISSAKAKDYDTVVIAGGAGVIKTLWEDKDLRSLLQDAYSQNKIVAAICAAPPTLSKAGILNGKKATMFPWDDGIKELTKYGAIYLNEETVVDGNIVTGRNPDASSAFGLKLCEVLKILHR